ncbi:MAG: ATP-binding protein, partial [Patescibacteria group bacterium]
MVATMVDPTIPSNIGQLTVGFHAGNTIFHLANHYKRVEEVVREIAQNILDAKSKWGRIILNLERRTLQARDNGDGASLEEMRQRIAQIGARRKGPKDIGEKGIGNLAPTAIARLYRMITRKRDAKPKTSFFQISLDREAIEGKAEVAFDYKWLESGFSLTSGGEVASTFIDVKDIEPAALRQLAKEANPAQFLADFLAEAFSAKIRETEIRLEIVVISEDGTQTKVMVKPIQFPGRREVIEIPTPRGPVTFEMYLSRTQTKNPKIEVNHQNRSSFPLQGVEMLWHEVAG